MSSNDELRKQVESLRQKNTSLQQEILLNSTHLSRIHERLALSSASPVHGQSNASVVAYPQTQSQVTCRSGPGSSASTPSVGSRSGPSSTGSSPRVNRHPNPSTSTPLRSVENTSYNVARVKPQGSIQQRLFQEQSPLLVSKQNTESAINHLARLQDAPANQQAWSNHMTNSPSKPPNQQFWPGHMTDSPQKPANQQPCSGHMTESPTLEEGASGGEMVQGSGEEFSCHDGIDGELMATLGKCKCK